MTPSAELAALRARHNQMGKLLDEIEALEQCFHSGDLAAVVGWEDALRQEFKRRIIETPFASVSDIIPAMIAEREQALADLGLREPPQVQILERMGRGKLVPVAPRALRVSVSESLAPALEDDRIPATLNHESP